MITSEKWQLLFKRMLKIGIHENDLQEKFTLGSGSGGQKINKSNSCVYLKHLPSNTVVKCQQERSRELNRYYARCRMCEKLESLQQEEKNEQRKLFEKIRRQKKRRSRRAKQKILDNKKHRSQVKKNRKAPDNKD